MDALIEIETGVPLDSKRARSASPSTKPEPITKRAVLQCEAYAHREVFTRHVYVETVLVDGGWAHVFECTKTGVRRRYGFEALS
jgi:hypothetical protein